MEDQTISIGASLGLDDPTPNPNPNPEQTPPPENPNPNPPPNPDQSFLSVFEEEMKQVNPEFKLDEKVSEMPLKEQWDYVKSNLPKPDPAEMVNDPFIKEYIQAKENGIDSKTFLQQQDAINRIQDMPSRDFLIEDLLKENGKTEENPNGWERKDVEEYVDQMSRIDIDLKAKERKENIFNEVKQANSEYLDKQKLLIKEESEKVNSTTIKETVDKLFNDMAGQTNIGGIPHTKEDQEAFKKMFTDTVSINPETGFPRTRELFNDDKVLYEVLYLYNKLHSKGEGSLRNFLSSFKEEYKQEILDKTRLSPRTQGGQYQTVTVPNPGDFI